MLGEITCERKSQSVANFIKEETAAAQPEPPSTPRQDPPPAKEVPLAESSDDGQHFCLECCCTLKTSAAYT